MVDGTRPNALNAACSLLEVTVSRSPSMLWTFLALSSAAGMLALGVLGMWNAGRAAEERARSEAVRAATVEARAIREALGSSTLIDALPAPTRFAFDAMGLVLPDGITWFETPPPELEESSLPGLVRDRLLRATQQEFVEGDPNRAHQTLLDTWKLLSDGASERPRIDVAIAWNAQRAGRDDEAAQLLETLRSSELPTLATVIEGTLLLTAERGAPWPVWIDRAWKYLPYERSLALMAALRAKGMVREDAERLASEAHEVRQTLRTVARLASLLRGTDQPSVFERDGNLLLFHPTDLTSGFGAWVAPSRCLATLSRLGVEVSHAITGSHTPSGAIPAGPAIAVLPETISDDSPWSRPTFLVALLVILGMFLIASLYLSLRAMRRATEQMRLRSEFLTSVTHELKTPLASVRLLSERLCTHRLPAAKQAEYHELVRGEIDRLSLLIENLLDLGRLERGERRIATRPVSPVELVEEIVTSYRPLVERDEILLELTLEPTSRQAALDREGFRQVLLNLLENARKYARSGKRIDVYGGIEGDRYVIRVRDYGEGIPPHERERIFERFERGAHHRESALPGMGIGLSTARLLVHAFGGELTLEPAPDERTGAVFAIALPFVPVEATRSEPT